MNRTRYKQFQFFFCDLVAGGGVGGISGGDNEKEGGNIRMVTPVIANSLSVIRLDTIYEGICKASNTSNILSSFWWI